MKERIGIFGGTFDPIHYGHLRSAEEIRERFDLGKVIFVPPFVHPLKSGDGAASARHRIEMARLAVQGNPAFDVSDFEVGRGEVSYTVVTLDHFREKYPSAELFFILGMDGWLEITSWYRYHRLFEQAHIVVHSRPGYPFKGPEEVLPGEMASKFSYRGESYKHQSGKNLWFIPVTDLKVSATEIRRRRSEGKSIRYLLPPQVLEFIEKHNLYAR